MEEDGKPICGLVVCGVPQSDICAFATILARYLLATVHLSQAQVVQKTVEIPAHRQSEAGNPPSVITQKQIMIVATPRLLGDSESAPFILKIQETLEILVVQRQVAVQRKYSEDC